ncbi:MAG: sigma 54-interacting transcriptional regulator [Desulfosalsimonas sp.]|uniref:sigma-54 interaction domain-containing protein n=1 Tax=Desulfosalsimonas sp. TaxID=3073848 RepID=UPI003970FF50
MDDHFPHLITGLFDHPVAAEAILEEIPTALILLDTRRRIRYMNRAASALTGYGPQEAKNIACHNIVRSRAYLKDSPVSKISPDSGPVCVHSDLINRERQRIDVRITMIGLFDPGGRCLGYADAIEDMRAAAQPETQMHPAFSFAGVIGKSPDMENIFRTLPLIAKNDSPVLITGETGTGKDLAARAIHENSGRARGPFVKINCGALPETLLESQLFGHCKGAFAGATENRQGRFRLAHNGTLYLAEIGDMPLTLQARLLNLLDNNTVYPMGGTRSFQVDVHVIAGDHRNLEQMAEQGAFRKDLLFRLSMVRLHLPPLRQREDDIGLLTDHFLHQFSTAFGKDIQGPAPEALELLNSHTYPGNVRELRNIIKYAVNVCRQQQITPADLPAYLNGSILPAAGRMEHDNRSWKEPIGTVSGSFQPAPEGAATWAETEKQMIIDALVRTGGRRNKAAALLGWGRSTLWRKIKQYQIQ